MIELVKLSLSRPMVLLITEPVVTSFSIYLAVAWGCFYGFLEAIPFVFTNVYDFSTGQVGLAFISIILGGVLGWTTNIFQERLYQSVFYSLSPVQTLLVEPQRPAGATSRGSGRKLVSTEHAVAASPLSSDASFLVSRLSFFLLSSQPSSADPSLLFQPGHPTLTSTGSLPSSESRSSSCRFSMCTWRCSTTSPVCHRSLPWSSRPRSL